LFRNYLHFALRMIVRNKIYSIVNIAGLAIGITCCILIMMWVVYELDFDGFHDNYDLIGRIEIKYDEPSGIVCAPQTPAPLAGALLEDCPDIANAARFRLLNKSVLEYGENYYQINRPAFADPSFLDIFTFPLLQGHMKTVLSDKYSVVLSEGLSHSIFGENNPLGQMLRIGKNNLKVTGVLKEIPQNSHLNFDCLIPFALMEELSAERADNWHEASNYTYVLQKAGARLSRLNQNISDIYSRYHGGSDEIPYVKPLKKIHLYHDLLFYIDAGEKPGDIRYIYIFSALAIFLLIVACINFINLATAQSEYRVKEICLRKINGAGRGDLIRQFLCETVLMVFISLLLASVLVEITLPMFAGWSGVDLSQNYFMDMNVALALIGIILFAGLFSGTFPALHLSSSNPDKILRGSSRSYARGGSFRKILVLVQFIISIFAIICSMTIGRQNEFIKKIDLGFDGDNLVYIPMDDAIRTKYASIRSELLNQANVKSVTRGAVPLEVIPSTTRWHWDGKDPEDEIVVHPMLIDYGYIEALGLEMVEGRGFSEKYPSDRSSAFIVNEAAAAIMGSESPLDKRITFCGIEGEIIGVVKDFHYGSVHSRIGPVILHTFPISHARYHRYICIRYEPANIAGTIAFMKEVLRNYAPESPCDYRFLDETMASHYQSEKRMSIVFDNFMFWSIFISCLGLIGLTSFTVKRRTREIGIRKVLGASIVKIIVLLSQESAKLVFMANLLAWPIAWLVMKKWLQGFAYRVSLDPVIFFYSGLVALIIALVTISLQALKAALTDPVNSLKHE
jgi:putative ABC transport system permease protein